MSDYSFKRREPGDKPTGRSSENDQAMERRARIEARDKANRERRQASERARLERLGKSATSDADDTKASYTKYSQQLDTATPSPAALSPDQILRRLVELEGVVASLKAGNDPRFGNRSPIFPAELTAGRQWAEQSITAGVLDAVAGNGRSCTSNSANSALLSPVPGAFLYESREGNKTRYLIVGFIAIWVKITGDATGGGKYNGKSYANTISSDVSASGNVSESELGTLAASDDCLVLNFAEEGETTHDLTAGTPENDTFLCHWYYTNSDHKKVCAVVAYDRETCE